MKSVSADNLSLSASAEIHRPLRSSDCPWDSWPFGQMRSGVWPRQRWGFASSSCPSSLLTDVGQRQKPQSERDREQERERERERETESSTWKTRPPLPQIHQIAAAEPLATHSHALVLSRGCSWGYLSLGFNFPWGHAVKIYQQQIGCTWKPEKTGASLRAPAHRPGSLCNARTDLAKLPPSYFSRGFLSEGSLSDFWNET